MVQILDLFLESNKKFGGITFFSSHFAYSLQKPTTAYHYYPLDSSMDQISVVYPSVHLSVCL